MPVLLQDSALRWWVETATNPGNWTRDQRISSPKSSATKLFTPKLPRQVKVEGGTPTDILSLRIYIIMQALAVTSKFVTMSQLWKELHYQMSSAGVTCLYCSIANGLDLKLYIFNWQSKINRSAWHRVASGNTLFSTASCWKICLFNSWLLEQNRLTVGKSDQYLHCLL